MMHISRILVTAILIVNLHLGSSYIYVNVKETVIKQLSEQDENAKSQCELHRDLYIDGLISKEYWALKMLDSTAKLNSGILYGNVVNMGNFDQCLSVEHGTEEDGVIRGKHCMVYSSVDLSDLENIAGVQVAKKLVNFERTKRKFEEFARGFTGLRINPRSNRSQTLRLGFGICVAASCQGKELEEQLNSILALANMTLDKQGYDSERMCSTKESVILNTRDWIAITVFGIIALLMILSTAYDLIHQFNSTGEKKHVRNLYLSFSAYSNLKRILAIQPNPPGNFRSNNIPCLHGIRVLSIIWIVFCHRYVISSTDPFDNSLDILDWITKYRSAGVLGSTISVDTFLVLSGLLVSYSFMKSTSSGTNVNIPMMYLHRYLRLTPPLAAMVLFQATLISYIGSGPYRKQFPYDEQKDCVDNWWFTLLYVQNYTSRSNMCLKHSWYLSVDMQVYIFSPIILYALWRYPRIAIGATVILILANIGIIFGITYVNEFTGSIINLDPNSAQDKSFNVVYIPTHARYGPMLMGMLLGYVLFKTLKVDVKINKIFAVALWLSAFAIMLAVVFGEYPLYQIDHDKNVIEASFYKSCSRIAWSLGISWMIFACTVGYGGYIDWFLSHPLWQPLSRLSYCLYITHYPIMQAISGSRKTVNHFSDWDMMYQFWGDFGISMTVTVIWSLAFESPVTIIEKELLHKPKIGQDKLKAAL